MKKNRENMGISGGQGRSADDVESNAGAIAIAVIVGLAIIFLCG